MSDLCCNSLGKVGTWKIHVRVPVLSIPLIRWNWNDGTGWYSIQGTSYTITQTLPDGIDVRVNYSTRLKGATWPACTPGGIRNLSVNAKTPIHGIASYQTSIRGWQIRVSYGNNQFANGASSSSPTSQCYLTNVWLDLQITSIVPLSTPTYNYNLKVFNGETKVWDETRSTNPTVEQISGGCEMPEEWQYVRDYQNWNDKDYCGEVGEGKGNHLILYNHTPADIYVPKSLAYYESPSDCSELPEYKVECEECKKCPENTCEVICDDIVCCYSLEGELIDSFPLEQLC